EDCEVPASSAGDLTPIGQASDGGSRHKFCAYTVRPPHSAQRCRSPVVGSTAQRERLRQPPALRTLRASTNATSKRTYGDRSVARPRTTRRRERMEFRIADTFTDSLSRLTAQEQKAVKTTAFDLQLDPTAPGMRFHKINRAKDPNFWSVRVNDDI